MELTKQPAAVAYRQINDAWRVEKILQCTARDPTQSIQHDHVFPKKALITILESRGLRTRTVSDLKELFSLLAVGCVVLKSEHNDLKHEHLGTGDEENPWQRYLRAGIALAHIHFGHLSTRA
jgi:hypothetical protein